MSKGKKTGDDSCKARSSNLSKFIDQNPYIQLLINTFDLVDENGDIIPDTSVKNDFKFSLFYNGTDNTKNTIPRKEINLRELVDIITSDALKDMPKKKRPYITPYGTFTKRNKESLVHFNKGIICLDYDKLKSYELDYIDDYWRKQPSTLLSLISPSGNGLKVLIRAEHGFNPDTLYEGLKANADIFTLAHRQVDLMQFVICQPMFIPYSENPYFNPHAQPMDVVFKKPKTTKSSRIVRPDKIATTKNLSRVNAYFSNRVNMLLKALQERPRGTGTHTYLYSIVMRLYPYLNQQSAISENELTSQLEQIILSRYNGDKSKVYAMHRSIAKAKENQLDLLELINKTAKIKI